MFEVLIIMNNYFHDVATAMLASAAFLMLAATRLLPVNRDASVNKYFLALYDKFTLIAKGALVWILIGGIPRLIYFRQIEWTIALDNRIIPALGVKHVFLFLLVLIGSICWWRLSKKVKLMKIL